MRGKVRGWIPTKDELATLKKAADRFLEVTLPEIAAELKEFNNNDLSKINNSSYPSPDLLAKNAAIRATHADISRRYYEGCAAVNKWAWAADAEKRAFRRKKFF
jgi:hypothetical protein